MRWIWNERDECARIRENLQDLIDGALSSTDAIAVSAHLNSCRECREEHRALSRLKSLLQGQPLEGAHEARSRVLARFRAAATVPNPIRTARPHINPRLRLALATAVLFAAAFPFYGLLNNSSTDIGSESTGIENALPSEHDLAEMATLHASGTAVILPAGAEIQQDTLADANSRLSELQPSATVE